MAPPRESLPPVRFWANCLHQTPLSSSVHQCNVRGAVRLSGRSFISKITYLVLLPVKSAFPQHWPPAWKWGRKTLLRSTTASMIQYLHTKKETQNSLHQEQDLLEDCDQFLLPKRDAGRFLSLSFFSPTRRSITPISIVLFLSPSLMLL